MATEFNNTITKIVVNGETSNELFNIIKENFHSPFFDGYYTKIKSLYRDRVEVLDFIEKQTSIDIENVDINIHYEIKAEGWDKEGVSPKEQIFGLQFGKRYAGRINPLG